MTLDGTRLMRNLLRDLRYGIRMWRKTPVLTLVTVFSLALAIAANTTMFALANSLLFVPFPYEEQDELVLIEIAMKEELATDSRDEVSAPEYLDLKNRASSFSGLCAFDDAPMVLSGLDQPEEVLVATVTPELFEVLGVDPILGRSFTPEDGVEETGNILVLDYGYWQRQFNGEESILGATLTLNDMPYTVVGVLPEEFNLLMGNVAAYSPSDLRWAADRSKRNLLVFGRLRKSVSVEQAQAEVTVIAEQFEQEYPESSRDRTMIVSKLRTRFPGRTDTLLIKITILVTLFGLLIACANIANLLLSKAGTRMKEVAVRMTLGAKRSVLFRQFISESVLLGFGSGLLGIFLAYLTVQLFRAGFPASVPRVFLPEVSIPVLTASVVLSVLAGILFGLAPALFISIKDVRGALSDGDCGGTAGRKWKRIRHAFVIGEVAVALGLLSGAGLLADIFTRLLNHEPGFNSDGLISFRLSLPEYRYEDEEALVRFHRESVKALKAVPGVAGVAVMNRLPRDRGYSETSFNLSGQTYDDPVDRPTAGWQAVSGDYFPTMQATLLSGRFLNEDDRSGSQRVITVNQSFVEEFLADQNPLGVQVKVMGSLREIVGVVVNVCQERIPEDFTVNPMLYLPFEQNPLRYPTYALRSPVVMSSFTDNVRKAIWSIDSDQPIGPIRSYEEVYRESLGAAAVFGNFLIAICIMAIFLAAMGIFGIISHSVVRRTREIGIRISVGAKTEQVVGLITRQGIWLTLKGFLLGAPLAVLMAMFVSSTFRIPEGEGLPLRGLSTIAVLGLVALVSSWIPARRAAKVQPMEALKAE